MPSNKFKGIQVSGDRLREREEKRFQLGERRKYWWGPASEFSEDDPREDAEDDYQENPNWQMDDTVDDMNYSNHS
jgi:hypothetical protein